VPPFPEKSSGQPVKYQQIVHETGISSVHIYEGLGALGTSFGRQDIQGRKNSDATASSFFFRSDVLAQRMNSVVGAIEETLPNRQSPIE
jgi:hypothetical protein